VTRKANSSASFRPRASSGAEIFGAATRNCSAKRAGRCDLPSEAAIGVLYVGDVRPLAFQEGVSVKVLFVCGPWGSGTSIVTRILIRLGAIGLSPYVDSRDPKTGNSYESVVYWDVLLGLANDRTFSLLKDKKVVFSELAQFRKNLEDQAAASDLKLNETPIVLKSALTCLFIEELNQIFDAKFIFVRRDVEEIEFGRIRRGWESFLGGEGARKAYGVMNKYSRWKKGKIYTVKYRDLLESPIKEVEKLAKFCNLKNDKETVQSAAAPIMNHPNFVALGKHLELR
jgi:hypothetical protein